MRKCPNCNSKKYRGNGFHLLCHNCGYQWKSPSYYKFASMNNSHNTSEKPSNSLRTTEKIVQIDYHRVAFKIPIKQDNKEIKLPRSRAMRNWIKELDETENVKIERTPKHIIFFLKRRIKKDIMHRREALKEAEDIIISEAIKFQDKYKLYLDIENMKPMRKEVKLLPSFLPAGTIYQGKISKSVYNDGSVEFIDKDKAMDHAQNFVEGLALINRVDKLENSLNSFAVGMENHMKLIGKLTETSTALTETAKTMQKIYKPLWLVIYEKLRRMIK